MAKQNGNGAGPLTTLRWILVVPINLALVLLFQALLIHTHPAPLTPERAAALPEFSGCEILDIAGPEVEADSILGSTGRSWVLYRMESGETHAVRVEWNMFLPRYRVETGVDFLIPAGESSYTFTARDFLGQNTVTVENGDTLTRNGSTGAVRQQTYIMWTYVLWVLGLFLAEAGVIYLIRGRRGQNKNKKR